MKHFAPVKDKCADVIEFVMSSADMPSNPSLLFKIRLSVEEVVENVVRYSYTDGAGWLEAGTRLEENGLVLVIEIRDAGVPFDPLKKKDPDITSPLEERQIGGLGIFLCKKMMDEVFYKYDNGCNVLTMKIKLQ